MYITPHLSTYKTKILVLGASESGKNSLFSKYTNGFSKSFEQSLGVDIFVRDEFLSNGESISYSCWVCAPQRRFEYYWPKFFRGASGAIIMFDLINKESFKEVYFWAKIVKKHLGLIPMILLGNKADLKTKRVIDYEEVKLVSEKLKFVDYIEISVHEDINVAESFKILNKAIQNYLDPDI
jgi:small GTP-binding protein